MGEYRKSTAAIVSGVFGLGLLLTACVERVATSDLETGAPETRVASGPASCERITGDIGVRGARGWRSGDTIGLTLTQFRVDPDGSPNTFRLDDRGLVGLCDITRPAGSERGARFDPAACAAAWDRARRTNDFGELTIGGSAVREADGRPAIQSGTDPLPGVGLVSRTTLQRRTEPAGRPSRYVDSEEIPFISLPRETSQALGIPNGAVALVRRPSTGAESYAIFADTSPPGAFGASVRLFRELGLDPFVTERGVRRAKARASERLDVLIFSSTRETPRGDDAFFRYRIAAAAHASYEAWGGADAARSCAALR